MDVVDAEGRPVPEGFTLHTRSSPLTKPWEPLYASAADGVVRIGFFVSEAHCNGRGFLHGGLISALADNAMGLSVMESGRRAGRDGLSGVTLNLSTDFVHRGEQGSWVEVRPTVHNVGRTVGVADCLVVAAGDRLLARASATFRILEPRTPVPSSA